ncbi:uncharacterized protein LOC144327333 isoform X3 [Podarcis muralis]
MQIPAKEHQPTRLVSCCCVLNSAQLFLRTINSLGEGKKKSTREEVPEGELGYSAAAETAENGNMECIWNTNSMDALQLSWKSIRVPKHSKTGSRSLNMENSKWKPCILIDF